jgi:hypothetical protein
MKRGNDEPNVRSKACDLAECKGTETAMGESDKRYRSVVDNIAIGVSVISRNMEILALNEIGRAHV